MVDRQPVPAILPGTVIMSRVLIIEDDQALYKPIKHVFEYEGFSLNFAPDGASGLESFRAVPPSLVVLDLKLPKIRQTMFERMCR